TDLWNCSSGLVMLFGRFAMIVPCLGIAGALAKKKVVPPSAGTFPTYGPLFGSLFVGVILIVGALTFFPALSLSPILEHLQRPDVSYGVEAASVGPADEGASRLGDGPGGGR